MRDMRIIRNNSIKTRVIIKQYQLFINTIWESKVERGLSPIVDLKRK
jgi:hypothetical protein